MTIEELRTLVSVGESDRQEFKKSTAEREAAMHSLCGMLNGMGGQVLFGVTEGKRIVGQQWSDTSLRELAQAQAKFEPGATFDQERVELGDGKAVLVLRVGTAPSGPYTYGGRAYRRVQSTTSIMPQAEYERLLLERGHAIRRWENQPDEGYRPEDLDEGEIGRLVADGVAAGRLDTAMMRPLEVLEKFHLFRHGRLTRAAVVAFARDPSRDYPQCALRLARFRGVTKAEFLDQQQLTGHAFKLLREADLFLRRHLPVAGRFESGVMERIDEPLFPPLALREALVNALIHRDYAIYGGAVNVAIYDDRLEVISAGTLPFGITENDLRRDHVSKPRNPHLAELFYRRGLIEKWGRGTQKIIDLCTAAGHPEPEFEEAAGDVVVRFLPSGYVPPHQVEHDLTERQRRILHALRDRQPVKAEAIRRAIDPSLPDRTFRHDLKLLREWGLIQSFGRGAGAKWSLA